MADLTRALRQRNFPNTHAGLIQRRTGKLLNEFAEEVLFGPLDITDYEWLGVPRWRPKGMPSAASGLRLRARDLAKIGSLVLHRGQWNGTQVISAEWVELSTRRHVEHIPWGSGGVYGYGFMWYPGRSKSEPGNRIIRAAGNGDQRLFIMPEEKIVVTVFAGVYNQFRHRNGEAILARVMAARIEED